MTAKSRFSISRLESLLKKTVNHMNGLHLKKESYKTDHVSRGKVMTQKMRLARELSKRRDSRKARGG